MGDLKLSYFLWSYRELPNATTGFSPYQLVYGKPGRGPLSVLKDVWTDEQTSDPNECKSYKQYFEKLRSWTTC